jgi:CBS domain containing-hemolysin-like protein
MATTAEFLLLVILLLASAFFSAAEIALVSLSRFRLKPLLDKGMMGAVYVKRLKDDPRRLLTTILIGNNLVNTAAAAIATGIALETFSNNAIAIATGVMTFLILVVGEIIPKSLAVRFNVPFALFFAPLIWGLSIVLWPVVKFFQLILKIIDSAIGIKKTQPTITEDELKSIVQMGEEEGAINELERTMIHRIFEFDDIPISEVMTNKAEMVMVSSKAQVKDVLNINAKKQFTRLPVYEKSRENIVGVLHVKDMMPYLKNGKRNTTVERLMRKPLFVPEAKKLDSLLRLFQKSKEHMAIVVNEHGSITGLITIEDVLEEIVGEIMDETDRVDPTIAKLSKKSWLVKGKTDIEELNEKLKMGIEDIRAGTLNGFIQEQTGKIPTEGDSFEYGKFTVIVQRMEGHRVAAAKIVKR